MLVAGAAATTVIRLADLETAELAGSNSSWHQARGNTVVVGVLLPRAVPEAEPVAWLSRLDSVLPGLVLATTQLPGFHWQLLVGDTDCNSTTGPLQAVDMFYRRRPDLFLGPVCPYVLGPVSRFASIWSIPVFTTGGMNRAFRDKSSEYRCPAPRSCHWYQQHVCRMLTTVGGNHLQFATFFTALLAQWEYRHITFIYHTNTATSGKGGSMCEFTLAQVTENADTQKLYISAILERYQQGSGF